MGNPFEVVEPEMYPSFSVAPATPPNTALLSTMAVSSRYASPPPITATAPPIRRAVFPSRRANDVVNRAPFPTAAKAPPWTSARLNETGTPEVTEIEALAEAERASAATPPPDPAALFCSTLDQVPSSSWAEELSSATTWTPPPDPESAVLAVMVVVWVGLPSTPTLTDTRAEPEERRKNPPALSRAVFELRVTPVRVTFSTPSRPIKDPPPPRRSEAMEADVPMAWLFSICESTMSTVDGPSADSTKRQPPVTRARLEEQVTRVRESRTCEPTTAMEPPECSAVFPLSTTSVAMSDPPWRRRMAPPNPMMGEATESWLAVTAVAFVMDTERRMRVPPSTSKAEPPNTSVVVSVPEIWMFSRVTSTPWSLIRNRREPTSGEARSGASGSSDGAPQSMRAPETPSPKSRTDLPIM